MPNNFFMAIISFWILGLYLRIKGTLVEAFAFTYDQGRDMLVLYEILHKGKISLIGPTTGLPGIFYGPWWYWYLLPGFLLSGGSPMVSVLAVAVVNALMIPLGFVLGKKIGGGLFGAFLSLIICYSPVFIANSAQLWNPNLVPFFCLLSIFFLYKILENKPKYFAFLGLALTGVFEFQFSFGLFFIFGLLLSLGILILTRRIVIFWRYAFLGLGFFLFVLSPRIIFDLRHNFLMTQAAVEFLQKPKVYQTALSLSERFGARLLQFFHFFSKTLTHENTLLGGIFLLLTILGSLLLFHNLSPREKNIRYLLFTLSTIAFTLFIGFSFYPDAVWDYYLVGLPTIYAVFATIALVGWKRILGKNSWILICIWLLVTSSPRNIIDGLRSSSWEGDSSVFANQKRVVETIYRQAMGAEFDAIVYSPALLDYQYQYLFLWLGKGKYGYLPTQGAPNVYYILEDAAPDRLSMWLEEHDGDGVVEEERVMPGNITVQIRRRSTK